MPDLILSTTLKEDDNYGLTFEETRATSDYWFQSNSSAATQHWGGLHTALKARAEGNKADGVASGGQNGGTASITKAVAQILMAPPMDTTKTTVAVDDGTQLEMGQTVLVGTLQMRVTGI